MGTWTRTQSGLLVRNGGSAVGRRGALNLHAGSGVSLTVADDPGNDEVDVTIAATGGGGSSSSVRVRRSLGSPQSIPNATVTTVTWDTTVWDDGPYDDIGGTNPERLTVPAGLAGRYLVACSVSFAANGTGARQLRLVHTGTGAGAGIVGMSTWSPTGFDATSSASGVVDLTEGDYLTVQVYQNSGGALNLPGALGVATMSLAMV